MSVRKESEQQKELIVIIRVLLSVDRITGINAIRIKVRPVGLATPAGQPRPRYMSATTRRHLEQTAGYIDDRALADALHRLAAAGRNDNG